MRPVCRLTLNPRRKEGRIDVEESYSGSEHLGSKASLWQGEDFGNLLQAVGLAAGVRGSASTVGRRRARRILNLIADAQIAGCHCAVEIEQSWSLLIPALGAKTVREAFSKASN